jgi:hypothetical protein
VGCRGGRVSDEHEMWISMLAVWIHIVPEDAERDVISHMRDSVVSHSVISRTQLGGGEDRVLSTRTTVSSRHLLGCSTYLHHNRWMEVEASFR